MEDRSENDQPARSGGPDPEALWEQDPIPETDRYARAYTVGMVLAVSSASYWRLAESHFSQDLLDAFVDRVAARFAEQRTGMIVAEQDHRLID